MVSGQDVGHGGGTTQSPDPTSVHSAGVCDASFARAGCHHPGQFERTSIQMTTDVDRTHHLTRHAARTRRTSGAAAVGNQLLGDADLRALRASLDEHRRFRLHQLGEIARGGSRDASTPHIEVSRKLAAAAHAALEEIEAALVKMDTGRYGRCSRCGRAISVDLLLSYPQAPYCTGCHRLMRGTE